MSARLLAALLCASLALAGCAQGPAATPPTSAQATTSAASSPSTSSPTTATPTTTSTGSSASAAGYAVPRSLHESTWLCQTPVTVDDLTTSAKEARSCHVTLSFTSTEVTVASTGIPNHDYESGGACCAKELSLSFKFPLAPRLATAVTMAPTRGPIALAVNGAQMYGPEDADGHDVVRVTYTTSSQPRLNLCDGHSDPAGMYHYHADANCIHYHPAAGAGWSTYSFDKVGKSAHSPIVGFAFDGFPIYGSYGYGANGTVKEMTSSYRLKAGAAATPGIKDYEYVAGLGDLDECNGHVERTPEFPDGMYVYYSTRHNGAGDLGFPYFPLCYKGVVTASDIQTMGGGAGGGGAGGTCPPPPGPGQTPTGPPPPGCGPPPRP